MELLLDVFLCFCRVPVEGKDGFKLYVSNHTGCPADKLHELREKAKKCMGVWGKECPRTSVSVPSPVL